MVRRRDDVNIDTPTRESFLSALRTSRSLSWLDGGSVVFCRALANFFRYEFDPTLKRSGWFVWVANANAGWGKIDGLFELDRLVCDGGAVLGGGAVSVARALFGRLVCNGAPDRFI